MSDATRLALAIFVLVISFVAFFFAFHPNGVKNVKNPKDMLQWLMAEFDVATTDSGAGQGGSEGGTTGQVLPSPTGKPLPGDLSKYFKG